MLWDQRTRKALPPRRITGLIQRPDKDPLANCTVRQIALQKCRHLSLKVTVRVSASTQDLTAQRNAPAAAGVDPDTIYVDHGFTGTQGERAGLGKALTVCRKGDTLVVNVVACPITARRQRHRGRAHPHGRCPQPWRQDLRSS
ncbi:recombinase family protein [Arthrobacter sp. B1I2]|uniref:recombinase family protein n=1 Tax=Arthrobacter sp. B1I2 TaxID=3042263 RepID=UPI0027D7F6FF|nr:recombinase family protein [Arthrobacter sp. B1I2]